MSFEQQMNVWVNGQENKLNGIIRDFLLDLHDVLNLHSPVGDARYWKSKPPRGYVGGHYRANWQYSTGQPKSGEIQGIRAPAFSIGTNVLGSIHWWINNVPYAKRIENGWSRQAPRGVVKLTALEAPRLLNDAVARHR